MGGRGASSSITKGSKTGTQDSLERYLGKKGNPLSVEKSLKTINPNYVLRGEWAYNCQSCTTAFEATQRGYDVQAVGHDKGKPYFPDENGKQHQWYDVYEGEKTGTIGNEAYKKYIEADSIYEKVKCHSKAIAFNGIVGKTKILNTENQIKKEMQSYGDGARATLVVGWKRGSGHIMNVLNSNGQVYVADAQSGKTFNLSDILPYAKKGVALTRVDNLKFNSNIQYLTKKKGE